MLSVYDLHEINDAIDDGGLTQLETDNLTALLYQELEDNPMKTDIWDTIGRLSEVFEHPDLDDNERAVEGSLESLDDDLFQAEIAEAKKRSLRKRRRSSTPPEQRAELAQVIEASLKDQPKAKKKTPARSTRGSQKSSDAATVCADLPQMRIVDAGGGGDCQFLAIGHMLQELDYPTEMTSLNFLRGVAADYFENPDNVPDEKIREAWETTCAHALAYEIETDVYAHEYSDQAKRRLLIEAVRTPGNLFWGDDITLEAIASYFAVRLLIVSPWREECFVVVYGPESAKQVLNLYSQGEHFRVIYLRNPVSNRWVCTLDLTDPTDRDIYNSLHPTDVKAFVLGSHAFASLPGAWIDGGRKFGGRARTKQRSCTRRYR